MLDAIDTREVLVKTTRKESINRVSKIGNRNDDEEGENKVEQPSTLQQ